MPLKVIQELLGHSLMSTTADVYATVLPVLMTDAADKMDAILQGPSMLVGVKSGVKSPESPLLDD